MNQGHLKDAAIAAALVALTLLVTLYLAPRGFHHGFVDMAHDGYQLRQALDLYSGGVIFRDTFDQYGPLSPYLNLFGFVAFGQRLLAIKYLIALSYGVTAVFLYLLARRLLNRPLSAFSVVAWLALAPFYQHGTMISAHAYLVLVQAAALYVMSRFVDTGRLTSLVLVGVLCGICWMLKQSFGVLFFAGVALSLLLIRRGHYGRRLAVELSALAAACAAVVAVTLATLAAAGALRDWYLQTVVFPSEFYLASSRAVVGGARAILSHFIQLQLEASTFWLFLRLAVFAGAVAAIGRRREPSLVVLGCVTLLLWLGAYPSGNYMHQWWTTTFAFAGATLVCQRAVAAVLARVAPNRIALAPAWTLLLIASVAWSDLRAREQAARAAAATLTETIREPWPVSGIKTDVATAEALTRLYDLMSRFRGNHPGTRIVSIDDADGVTTGIAASLPLLSFFDDNRHDQPIYWHLPVLSSVVYPDYFSRFWADVERTQPLIVDHRRRFERARSLPGYYLFAQIASEEGFWYLYAPRHAEQAAHGEDLVSTVAERATPSAKPTGIDPLIGRKADSVAVAGDGPTQFIDVYVWPPDIVVTPSVIALPSTEPAAIDYRAEIVRRGVDDWTISGSADARYSYLLQFKPERISVPGYLLMTGRLNEGGFSVGLTKDTRWIGYVNVDQPGPFAIVIAPSDRDAQAEYSIIVANFVNTTWWQLVRRHGTAGLWSILSRASRPNDFHITRLGWVQAALDYEPVSTGAADAVPAPTR